ncbi:MAG: hypothetical protein GY853_14515 [PVC group bacterium]|nr:hypothetical protein [PVC group bacterium]
MKTMLIFKDNVEEIKIPNMARYPACDSIGIITKHSRQWESDAGDYLIEAASFHGLQNNTYNIYVIAECYYNDCFVADVPETKEEKVILLLKRLRDEVPKGSAMEISIDAAIKILKDSD